MNRRNIEIIPSKASVLRDISRELARLEGLEGPNFLQYAAEPARPLEILVKKYVGLERLELLVPVNKK